MNVLSDAIFANAMKSQLCFVTLLADEHKRAEVVRYGSPRCHNISRSVMAAELYAPFSAFDNDFFVWEALDELSGRRVEFEAFLDSRMLISVMEKNSSMAERKLQIGVSAFKETIEKRNCEGLGGYLVETTKLTCLKRKLCLKAVPPGY